MWAWNKGEKIVLWGTGKKGKRYYYLLRNQYHIVGFFDNHKKEETLYGLPVLIPNEQNIFDNKIVICSNFCDEIQEQCKGMGLSIFYDFLPYYMVKYEEIFIEDIWKYAQPIEYVDIIDKLSFSKKVAYINGNCQTLKIKQYLMHNKGFASEYIFLHITPIHQWKGTQSLLFDNLDSLINLKLFITQWISENNRFDPRFGTEQMVRQLKSVAKNMVEIKIPKCFFDVYFPQTGLSYNKFDVLREDKEIGVFPYPDWILDELSKRYEEKEIVDIVCSENIFSHSFMDKYVEYRFANLYEREEKCDIKIVDFIQKNYKEECLFFSKNHPNNHVLAEISRRILVYLHMSPVFEKEKLISEASKYQEFIYPSVYESLGLKFEKEYYSDGDSSETHTLQEIVDRYLSYCHGMGTL